MVTGAAGPIGMHVPQLLLAQGDEVLGLDDLNDCYDPQLKTDRLARLIPESGFRFVTMEVADRPGLKALFETERFDRVVSESKLADSRPAAAMLPRTGGGRAKGGCQAWPFADGWEW